MPGPSARYRRALGHLFAGGHDHSHGGTEAEGHRHGHVHGAIDAKIVKSARGLYAVKWSFVALMATAIVQLGVVFVSGSVALLADTVHNLADATTAVPLGIAFLLARRGPSARFPYGLGRAEDIAGAAIVGIILFSAAFAGIEAIDRLLSPRPIANLGAVAVAGILGFLGNEAVALFRIRIGREISSAALIADGYHARADGLTSLAVVAGAAGAWLGFPLADPIVGLLIAVAILGIVWQSGRTIFFRMLDGIEPEILARIRHALGHAPGIVGIPAIRARWSGHWLIAEAEVEVDGHATVAEAYRIREAAEAEIKEHLPSVLTAAIRVRPARAG